MKKTFLKDYQFKMLQDLDLQMNCMIDEVNHINRKWQITKHRPNSPPDPYPWLESSDPRCYLSDEEILDQTIDLSMSCLSRCEKNYLMKLIKRYKKAFSLRDEIGECLNIWLNINVIDDSPSLYTLFQLPRKINPSWISKWTVWCH